MKHGATRRKNCSNTFTLLVLYAFLTTTQGLSSEIVVTNSGDSGPGSLRQAIEDAGPDGRISFAVRGTILLTNGELLITNDLQIAGPGKDQLTISGNDSNRLFEIASNATVVISGLTLSSGHAPDGAYTNRGLYPPQPGSSGGAFLNMGSLILSNCIILRCTAGNGGYAHANGYTFPGRGGDGGGVYNANQFRAFGCSFETNSAGHGGYGSAYSDSSPSPDLSPGGDGGSGGAIYNGGDMYLTNCAFVDNRSGDGESGGVGVALGCYPDPYCAAAGGSAGSGGAIFNSGTMNLLQCRLLENNAGGSGFGGGSSPPAGGSGGGIHNRGTAFLTSCTLDHNLTGLGRGSYSKPGEGGPGGGICNEGLLQASACSFGGNATARGASGYTIAGDPYGRVMVYPGGSGGCGGALANSGEASLTNCTFSKNSSGSGGDGPKGGMHNSNIYPAGPGGNGGDGGAIYNYPTGGTTCLLVACTINANWAGTGGIGGTNVPPESPGYYPPSASNGTNGSGGGIFNGSNCQNCGQSLVQLLNTIIANNETDDTGPDLMGTFSSLGHNLIGQSEGATGLTNGIHSDLVGSTASPINAQLGELADNSGPTLTVALLHGSPALESGDDALTGPPFNLATDQRGFPRKSGAHVDIGALEFQEGAPRPTLFVVSGHVSAPFKFVFTNTLAGATFTVLSSANLNVEPSGWTVAGQAVEIAPGFFQFSDAAASNTLQRVFRVSSP